MILSNAAGAGSNAASASSPLPAALRICRSVPKLIPWCRNICIYFRRIPHVPAAGRFHCVTPETAVCSGPQRIRLPIARTGAVPIHLRLSCCKPGLHAAALLPLCLSAPWAGIHLVQQQRAVEDHIFQCAEAHDCVAGCHRQRQESRGSYSSRVLRTRSCLGKAWDTRRCLARSPRYGGPRR